MRDLYLRFHDEEEMRRALVDVGFTEEGPGRLFHHLIAIDVVGEMTINIGSVDAPVFSTLPGWHVNLRVMDDALDISALGGYSVIPTNPVRVWA